MTSMAAPFVDPNADALLARAASPRRALFLDRDGVINVDRDYVHRPADVEWVPGIFDLVREASAAGDLPIVVTNQAGIARGYYDEATFLDFTRWMHAQFAAQGAPLLATYFCPHHPESGLGAYRVACACRKPAPGMLEAAVRDFGLRRDLSALVGDKAGDIEAGRAAGVHTLLQLRSAKPDAGAVLGTPLESLQDAWSIIEHDIEHKDSR